MTNSDIVEEILFKSHSLQIQQEVMGYAETLMIDDPKLDKATAYDRAFNEISEYGSWWRRRVYWLPVWGRIWILIIKTVGFYIFISYYIEKI